MAYWLILQQAYSHLLQNFLKESLCIIIPNRSASSAETLSPNIAKANAFWKPINLGKKKVPALSGTKPIKLNAWIKLTFS